MGRGGAPGGPRGRGHGGVGPLGDGAVGGSPLRDRRQCRVAGRGPFQVDDEAASRCEGFRGAAARARRYPRPLRWGAGDRAARLPFCTAPGTPMKRIIILGSTGSIGRQALEIVQRTGEYQVVGLGARRDVDTLREQTRQFRPQVVAMTDAAAARRLRADISPRVEILSGPEAMRELAVR